MNKAILDSSLPPVAIALGALWSGRLVTQLPEASRFAGMAGHAVLLALVTAGFVLADVPRGELSWGWSRRTVLTGIAAAPLLFVVAAVGYGIAAGALNLSPPPEQALVPRGLDPLLPVLLLTSLLAALLEEWIFRGLLLSHLRSVGPAGIAIVVSSITFAAYHLSPFQLLPTLLLGVGLASMTVMTGSLAPAVVAHMTFNVLGLLLTSLGPTQPGTG